MNSGAKVVTIQTPNFGELQVPEDKIIYFREGIPGFPAAREFAILEFEDVRPFQYLQSLGDPPIALLVVNPFLFAPSYRFDLSPTDMEDLKCARPEDATVFAVATIPPNPSEATINLMAPVLVNAEGRVGKQVILLEGTSPMRHPLLGSADPSGGGS
jgi:flagellar assembly factor FliW